LFSTYSLVLLKYIPSIPVKDRQAFYDCTLLMKMCETHVDRQETLRRTIWKIWRCPSSIRSNRWDLILKLKRRESVCT